MTLKMVALCSLSLLISISLISCTTDTSDIRQEFLDGNPCEPPCWYGLQPGVSSEVQVRERLKGLSFIDQANVFDHIAKSQLSITWFRAGIIPADGGVPELVDGLLQETLIWGHNTVALREVFAKYGPPNCIRFYEIVVDTHLNAADLYYPIHGVIVQVAFPMQTPMPQHPIPSKVIQLDMPVRFLTYERAMSLEEMLKNMGDDGFWYIDDSLLPWE